MLIKMLFFDYKPSEQNFFKRTKLTGFDIHFFEESLNETTVENLPDHLKTETTVISIFITSSISDAVLEKFPNLKILSTRSTGYDHIKLEDCKNKNIKVLNVENYGSKAVVQYTFGLMITLIRKILIAEKDVRAYKFEYHNYVGRELDKLTLGVIGTGAIGSEICHIANAFGMKILAWDSKENLEIISKYNVKYTDKTDLLKNSDVITLHLPLTDETKQTITRKEFAIMKSSAVLINTSRGELVNTEDLYNAITTGNLAGAGLDVIECENIAFSEKNIATKIKKSNPNCVEKVVLTRKLAQLDNVIVTPHVAYSTQDSIDRILTTTFNSIKDCIQGGHTNQIN